MIVFVLAGLVVLATAGCVCVVWAARGGPRWVRGVSVATLAAGELVRGAQRSSRKHGPGGGADDGDD
ncbi:hypothetical protein ACIRSU_06625 [Streptomyces sp. NPDC101160]|uniref:hypothetical protein n=1 Tax=Streptomyces sp. NPDC101160 TaxID=3366118 RepID=UPI00381457ED